MRPILVVSSAILLSSAISAQQPLGVVKSVTAAATGETGRFQFTVRGDNPCGAVYIDLGDGSEAITFAIERLPYTVVREYEKAGTHRAIAKGMGNCIGEVTTEVTVTAVRPRPARPTPPPTPPSRPAPAPAIRFADMDDNGNREISRTEWRGSARSFAFHDWNSDNKLSGDEGRLVGEIDDDKGDNFDDLDLNKDNRLARNEWHGNAAAFQTLDRNNDGVLTRAEAAKSIETSGVRTGSVRGGSVSAGQTQKPGAAGAVMVAATREWTDTGVTLQAGDLLDITASGQIFYAPGKGAFAPPSGSGRATAAAPMPNVEIGALLGRIGDGRIFFVGETMAGYRAQTAGRLFLRVNDDVLTDNRGEFRAQIAVTRR